MAASPTVIFALLTPEPVSFPEQTFGSATEVSQTLVKNMEQSAFCTQFKQRIKSYLFNAF